MQRRLISQDDLLVDLTEESLDNLHVVADHCKALHNEGLTGTSDIKHLATIPAFVIEKWCNDNQVSFARLMNDGDLQAKMLNDPDLSAFRVYKGRVKC